MRAQTIFWLLLFQLFDHTTGAAGAGARVGRARGRKILIGLRESIKEFLEKIYNQKRWHSVLGYRPPREFERSLSLPCAVQQEQRHESGRSYWVERVGDRRSCAILTQNFSL